MENLATAYARARAYPAPAFALQTAAPLPAFMGQRYDSPHDGKGAAAYALHKARANLAAFRDARAEYEDSAVARDHAREESNAAKAAAQSLAREGGPAYEAAAQAVTAAAGAYDMAERRHARARAEVARLRNLCAAPGPDYGAGFWQGEGGPRHMAAGDKGGQFFALYDGGTVRNIRDAHALARLGHTGYYDNPHGESFRDGSGLIVGVVGQLRGRDGRAVFVPGWRLGDDCQGGAQFDMRAAVVAEGREESDAEEAAEDCARIADGMAETVAEAEREYKTAWGAGAAWADAGERLAAIRAEVREILAERREAARTGPGWPALCKAIRARVDSLLADRAEAMAERARLAEGDESPWVFYPDADARAAFCEGAGVERFPA